MTRAELLADLVSLIAEKRQHPEACARAVLECVLDAVAQIPLQGLPASASRSLLRSALAELRGAAL